MTIPAHRAVTYAAALPADFVTRATCQSILTRGVRAAGTSGSFAAASAPLAEGFAWVGAVSVCAAVVASGGPPTNFATPEID